MKQPIQNKKEDMKNILNSLKSVAELKKQMLKEIDKVKENKKDTDVATEAYKKTIVNVKEGYMNSICEKVMFDEVYKKQIKIIEDKEKEDKNKKLEDIN